MVYNTCFFLWPTNGVILHEEHSLIGGTAQLFVPRLQVGARHGGVDEETVPNYGMVAFRAGRSGGERGIRTLDGVAPKPHFQCGAIDH